ncbi:hypothetical protein [Curtobacterium pusillum]|uniref:hypothetical protein n=1 Tax=Curtobacterium pusillum TaxID=69373 RepID=UPI0011A7E1B6|nr:hypothetical protein [Curtobacterium pusillum]
MGENVQTAPVMAAHGRKMRPRGWGLALLGVVALVLSPTSTTWSASAEYGGTDADGNWIDNAGNPVSSAPPTVHVEGHVAPVALAVLLLVVVVGVFLPPTLERFGQRALGDIVRYSAYLAAPVVVVVGVLVYTVWQGHVVVDQVQHEVLHPHGFPWGGVTVTTGHMTR